MLTNHVFYQHRDIYDNYQSKEAAKKRKAVGTIQSFIVYGGDFKKECIRWIVEFINLFRRVIIHTSEE